jgi:hypothetical protein
MTAKPKSQIQKFREAARAVGTHDSEKRFNAALKGVAKAPAPAKDSKPEPKKPSR